MVLEAFTTLANRIGGNATTLRRLAELARQTTADDAKFVKSFLYFFELRVPQSVAATGDRTFFFPLILPPESLHLSESFALSERETLNAGLFVEENGIIAREIKLSGTTGFKPRTFPRGFSANVPFVPPDGSSYTRTLSMRPYPPSVALSGQRHFQLLQDRIFRTYADLKRDISTAPETELYFHIPRDDEHWRVFPRRFETTEDKGSPLTKRYDIELLAIPASTSAGLPRGEDEPVIDVLTDPIRIMRSGALQVRAALADVQKVESGVNFAFRNLGAVIADYGFIADDIEKLVQGAQDFIRTPITLMNSVQFTLEQILETYYSLRVLGEAEEVPGAFLNSLRKMRDAVDITMSYPEKFQQDYQRVVDSYKEDLVDATRTTAELQTLEAASETNQPTSMRDYELRGTAALPGDYLRALATLGLGNEVPRYTGAFEHRIARGENLTNLASRYLGDARRWKFIAMLNGLQAPFISEERLPNTRRTGDTIFIPDFSRAPEARGVGVTLGVPVEASTEEALLGADFELALTDGGYDLVIDNEHGSVDCKLVVGRQNLAQAMRTRMVTERGTDLLYQSVGIAKAVGLGLTAVDVETLKFRVLETIQADPRVTVVRGIDLKAGGADGFPVDAIDVEVEVEIRGFGQSEKIMVKGGT
jgi:hypothetical protein